jgi:hypothetical protein
MRKEIKTKTENGGRKEITIDWNEVNKYLMAGCSGKEISSVIGCHDDTLFNHCKAKFGINWADYSAIMRSKGDSLLLSKQFDCALKENVPMLIWLGKQRLHQTDTQTIVTKFDGALAKLLDNLATITTDDFKEKTNDSANNQDSESGQDLHHEESDAGRLPSSEE